jgi:hypothetical protein
MLSLIAKEVQFSGRGLAVAQPKPPHCRDDLTVLDHYTVDTPTEGDRKVIQYLVESGADMALPRHTIHFLDFRSPEIAADAAERLGQAGYIANRCERVDNDGNNQWPVLAETTDVVNDRAMELERVFLDGFAGALGGKYDGWEAQID